MRKRSAKSWVKELDTLFSRKIRTIGKCQRCGKINNLQCSHIYTRNQKAIRWDAQNALCLCAGCHFWWHQNPIETLELVKKIFGEDHDALLRSKARNTHPWFEENYQKVKTQLNELK